MLLKSPCLLLVLTVSQGKYFDIPRSYFSKSRTLQLLPRLSICYNCGVSRSLNLGSLEWAYKRWQAFIYGLSNFELVPGMRYRLKYPQCKSPRPYRVSPRYQRAPLAMRCFWRTYRDCPMSCSSTVNSQVQSCVNCEASANVGDVQGLVDSKFMSLYYLHECWPPW